MLPAKLTFSVVIPAYNIAPVIEPTLRSILAQTRQPDEVIIVDDGSTDGTADAALSIMPSAKVLREPHRGLPATRNTGWRASSGSHVAFLDGDDLWTPSHLAQAERCLLQNPDVHWYTCAWHIRDNIRNNHRDIRSTGPFEAGRDVLCYFTARPHGNFPLVGPGTVIAARSLVNRSGGFDETVRRGEDIEFWSRLGGLEHRIGYGRSVGMIYVKRRHSLSEASPPAPDDVLSVCEKLVRNLMTCSTLTPAQRVIWFTPWARLYMRILIAAGATDAARRLLLQNQHVLSASQKTVLRLFQLWPKPLQSWYLRKSVLRQWMRI